MKATCNGEKLKNAIALADRMTGKASTLPALHSLLIVAEKNKLTITATNLSIGVALQIPAVIEEEGKVLVKGDVLVSVCSNLSGDGDVMLALENDNMTLATKRTKTIVKSMLTDEFPQLPAVEGDTFTIPAGILREGIRSVYFSAAITDIKPEIASIFLYSDADTIVFVATDSFRLAEKKIACKGLPEISKILIPFKNIADMLRVLDSFDEGHIIEISYNRNQIALRSQALFLTSRLIDGGFPPYQMILPKEEKTKVVILKQELLQTLRLSTIFADKFFQVQFSVDPVSGSVVVDSKNSDVGSAISTMDAAIQGEPIDVSFNLKYFLDVFQAIQGDSVVLSFTAPNKAFTIKSVQDPSFLYLMMPTNR